MDTVERTSHHRPGRGDYESVVAAVIELTDAELDERVRSLELQARELAVEQAAVLSVVTARRSYELDGHRSVAAYLRATSHASPFGVARQRKLADLCDAAPTVAEAVLAGHVPVDHALLLDTVRTNPRIGHVFPDVVETFLDHAEHLSYADFKIVVRQFIRLADQDGSFIELEHNIATRNATVAVLDGVLDVVVSGGDPLTAARVQEIFRTYCQVEFQRDREARAAEFGDQADSAPMPRTAQQRRFDALVRIFDTAAAAEHPAEPAVPIVNILFDAKTFDQSLTRAGLVPTPDELGAAGDLGRLVEAFNADPVGFPRRRCETTTGVVVDPMQALQAALLGHVRRVVVDSKSVVIDLGHKQRLFTGNARIAAQLLYRHCAHPGCEVPTLNCDVDHVQGWSSGGPTDQANAGNECLSHNVFKHQSDLSVVTDAAGRRFTTRAEGTIMLAAGERPPPGIDRSLLARRFERLRNFDPDDFDDVGDVGEVPHIVFDLDELRAA